MPVRESHAIAIAACAFEVAGGASSITAIQLTPAGVIRGKDGRPKGLPGWRMDASIAARVIARAAALTNDLVIDYEHQTLNTESNGQPAPAAGWFRSLEWREGQGLFAVGVRWTERAKQMIAAGEYRYISPVFRYDPKTGEILQILHAALTNDPNLDGMSEVALRAAARFLTHIEEPMNKEFLKLLGLPENATEPCAIAALRALQSSLAEKDQVIAAAKAQSPDPAKYVPVTVGEAIKGELAALKTTLVEREVNDLVQGALSEGKLLPAQEAWAKELGKTNIAALKQYIGPPSRLPHSRACRRKGKHPREASKTV